MDIDDFRRPGSGTRLKVDVALDHMDDDTRTTVLQALRGPRDEYPDKTIATVLSRNGWPMSNNAIRNWRNQNG